MSEQDVMEKLLLVLTKLEARLESLESSNRDVPLPLDNARPSEEERSLVAGSGEDDLTSIASQSQDEADHEFTEEERLGANKAYNDSTYPTSLVITDALPWIRPGDNPWINHIPWDETMQATWTEHLGHLWRLPLDGRIAFSFQRHIIDLVPSSLMNDRLKCIQSWFEAMGEDGFEVRDYDQNGKAQSYTWGSRRLGQPSVDDLMKNNFFFPASRHANNDRPQEIPSAPWRRLITLKGLTSPIFREAKSKNDSKKLAPMLAVPGQNTNHQEVVDHPVAKRLLAMNEDIPIFPSQNREWHLHHLLKHHQDATFAPERPSWHWHDAKRNYLVFHVVAYMIFDENWQRSRLDLAASGKHFVCENWSTGYLYDKKTKVIQVAYSVYGVCVLNSNKDGWDTNKWTILRLLPRYEPKPTYDVKSSIYVGHRYPVFADTGSTSFYKIVHEVLSDCLIAWQGLSYYFDIHFASGKVFLDPKQHDSLLSDDEAFSRSRKYFWALSCLKEFDLVLANTMHQWEQSKRLWMEEWPKQDRNAWSDVEDMVYNTEEVVEEMRKIKKKFLVLRDEIVALRDGLFNASSVMESRDANRLGENVKLLTSVSIFFLPLAYTSSIFSINKELFSPTALPWASLIIALFTYLVVFNLNTIVRFLSSSYGKQRKKTAKKMQGEEEPKWQERGKLFEEFDFRPKGTLKKPSEWLIGGYWVVSLSAKINNLVTKQFRRESNGSKASQDVEGA